MSDIFVCSKCGDNGKPYTRKRKRGGKVKISVSSYCILCAREEQRIRDARIYRWKLGYNRAWRKKNRDKVNALERKYYRKSRLSPVIYMSFNNQ